VIAHAIDPTLTGTVGEFGSNAYPILTISAGGVSSAVNSIFTQCIVRVNTGCFVLY